MAIDLIPIQPVKRFVIICYERSMARSTMSKRCGQAYTSTYSSIGVSYTLTQGECRRYKGDYILNENDIRGPQGVSRFGGAKLGGPLLALSGPRQV